MLIRPNARQIFVDLGYEPKACAQLRRDTWDDEFLAGRVIFLTTYGTSVDLPKLIDECGLATTIVAKLARHAELATMDAASKEKVDPMQDMALAETLKLMFNVTHFCKEKADDFTPAVPHILTILATRDVPSSRPLDGPFAHLVNALVNLKLDTPETKAVLYPEQQPEHHKELPADRLITLLDIALATTEDTDLEQTVTPLVTVLRVVHDAAPAATQKLMRTRMLSNAEDRTTVLGKGTTLPARLLRNSTNPLAPQLRDGISHLLFELSERDAGKFVDNVGYGFASGFLFQNNIPMPRNATGESGGSSGGRPINPITGQFLDREPAMDAPEMTDEEKEREAERLFVLFERYVPVVTPTVGFCLLSMGFFLRLHDC